MDLHSIEAYTSKALSQIATLNTDLILFSVLLICAFVVLDVVNATARKKKNEMGLGSKVHTVSIDGSQSIEVRHYVSDMQGLAGRPDALISEGGFIIPVERKPLANKIRDRYVAQLLVYMRLVEEFEGKRPPYGYLILGPNCRKFRIENSTERQAWLQKMLQEMRGILDGSPSVPAPHQKKCKRCDVRDACDFRADLDMPIQINSKSKLLVAE